MPLGTNNVTVTTAATFIPEIWSDEIVAAYKKKPCFSKLGYEDVFQGKEG